MDDQRTPPGPEGSPRQVTIRDRRRVSPEGPRPVEAVHTAAAPANPAAAPASPAANPATSRTEAPAPAGPVATPATAPGSDEALAAAQKEAAGYLEDLQRLKAEFDNYRKR